MSEIAEVAIHKLPVQCTVYISCVEENKKYCWIITSQIKGFLNVISFTASFTTQIAKRLLTKIMHQQI